MINKIFIWCAYPYAFGQNMGKQTYRGPFTLIKANHAPFRWLLILKYSQNIFWIKKFLIILKFYTIMLKLIFLKFQKYENIIYIYR